MKNHATVDLKHTLTYRGYKSLLRID